MHKAISFMAIAKGTESHEVEVKRYIGIGAVGVLATNPSRFTIVPLTTGKSPSILEKRL